MKRYKRSNFLVIISAPSGGGKSTICQAILDRMNNIDYSISYTTREPRKDETDGRSYFFVTKERFQAMIDNDDLLEYAEVHKNMYGTSRSFIMEIFSRNHNAIMDIDVQGAEKIAESGIDCVTIFLLPPDIETLKTRLEKRNTDTQQVISLRLANAEKEIEWIKKYNYLVINDDLEKAVVEVESIITAEQNKVFRYELPEDKFYGGK